MELIDKRGTEAGETTICCFLFIEVTSSTFPTTLVSRTQPANKAITMSPTFQVFVQCDRPIVLNNVTNEDTIGLLKLRIQDRSGLPPSFQRLVFAGRELHSAVQARECGLEQGSTLHLRMSVNGGMHASAFANAAKFNKPPPPNYVAGLGRGYGAKSASLNIFELIFLHINCTNQGLFESLSPHYHFRMSVLSGNFFFVFLCFVLRTQSDWIHNSI
jgi:ubiquitin-like protein Nedd8